MMTSANTTVQMSVDPALRGRVMALYMAIFMGGTPIGAPIVGWVGGTFGARWSILIGGVIAIAVSAGAAVWVLRSRHLRVQFRRDAVPHLRLQHDGAVSRS